MEDRILVKNAEDIKYRKANILKRILAFFTLGEFGCYQEEYGGELGYLIDFGIDSNNNQTIIVDRTEI